MSRNVTAVVLTVITAFCTSVAPATAAVHASAETTGVMSVIRRALERRALRLEEASSAVRASVQTDSSILQKRVLERARARIQEQGDDAETPWQPDLAKTLFERRKQGQVPFTADTELTDSVAERRKLRQMQNARSEKENSDIRRRKQSESERESTVESRRALREQKAEIAEKRTQYQVLRMELLDAVNRERRWAGIPALTYNKNLEMSAQLHAEDMYVRGYFDHFTPEGLSYVDRIKNMGYASIDISTCNCTAFKAVIGENIAKGQRSVNWVMNEWMDSPSHRKNILSPYFKEMGVGIADKVWVQNFGSVEVTPR
ncbi:hypothetical protein COU78_01890 [Candidatus Peregrinibacteria bacterium CG10_big_fil_rev_8_21_14_0_10_49_24]|nr:MAG: hypothetical protein COV83_06000 [Candidatus Peregrinibacteria bacterium CG11_big_fil_rev_8_21_14_0_20_49_14]PIR51319.1 MAG: hypothetical protein COU78_01890 [Candidatus Peregrinibacteria bacterium CG10_big_fil_rev_8_21_14_0_10_49_24]PJA67424.1 MAG: hypothetical protein CO157_04740 [Candidatus Peregrinibacteria bacterium CG_4_9_14_3_um_filter_49_12]